MEDEDFLAEIGKDDEAVTTEAPAVEPVVETPAEPVAEPVVETPAEPAKPEPGFVPFAAVLDERDKRKELQAEIERMRQAQPAAQPQPRPDMFEDPDGFVNDIEQKFEMKMHNQTLRISERFARQQHGDELTDTARQWAFDRCNEDPHFNAKAMASGDPFGFAIQEYQRDQIASSVTADEFAQFTAWKQAQAGLTPAPAAPIDNPSPAKPPPRSLASAPSAGPAATEPVESEEEIFAGTFARK